MGNARAAVRGIAMLLIVRSPAHLKPGTVVDELVTALDLAPTFINLAGGEVPPGTCRERFLRSGETAGAR